MAPLAGDVHETDPDPGPTRSRRAVLATAAGSLAALAGCSGGDDGSPTDGGTTEPTGEASPTTTTRGTTGTTAGGTGGTPAGTSTERTTAGELDLREANVTGVEVERSGEEYRFSVTLYHDDDGEDGYANWWQVETTGGERLGRRDLLHAHGTQEFTRSATVSVPDGVTDVVVRGHDQRHDYGGQAALVALDSGGVELVRQGSDPRSIGG